MASLQRVKFRGRSYWRIVTELDLKLDTLFCDKGNNSKANPALVDASALGYVASLGCPL